LTDSGGFQAFSLGETKFSEEGVIFKSHINGKRMFLSPEYSIQIQANIGSDIILVLDQALAAEVSHTEARQAMYLTQRWAKRSQDMAVKMTEFYPNLGVLFGIPQGAQFVDLRKESARLTMELNFPGYSIGGVANGGEPEEVMYTQVLTQTEILEEYKPRHLLGVGTPKDLVQMVARGIDMFDCVQPTRIARHGSIYIKISDTEYTQLRIAASKFAKDFTPINTNSKFLELRTYTKAYLRHLFNAKELLAYRLASLQNLEFYLDLMEQIRTKINEQKFATWYKQYTKIGIQLNVYQKQIQKSKIH
jgi:queuine tRNA-ribosyltransferase